MSRVHSLFFEKAYTEEANMAKSAKNIASAVRELLSPVVEGELGYYLWDVEYVKEGSEYYLRITIDQEDGIDINDCERVHRAIDPILDEADPIESSYRLEVSSPGIERELRTEEHILACEGWEAEARLYAAAEGSKVHRGVILGYEDGILTLGTPAGELKLERKNIGGLKTVFDFDDQ